VAFIASDGHGGGSRPHRIDAAYRVARDLLGEDARYLVEGVALDEQARQQAS
jgi:tyrosine-protein phosphatase YwqE